MVLNHSKNNQGRKSLLCNLMVMYSLDPISPHGAYRLEIIISNR